MWQAAISKIDVPQVRLHDARHIFATLMHLQGVPIALVAAWLGHADISFAMRKYVHAQADALDLGRRPPKADLVAHACGDTFQTLVTICDNFP